MIPAGIPFVGYLRHTRPSDHVAALRELAWTYFLAYLPVWVALLIYFLTSRGGVKDEFFHNEVDSGSIFLISSAMFSSYVFFMVSDQPTEGDAFPHRAAFGLLFVAMIVAWAVVIGIKSLSLSSPQSIHINTASLRTLTLFSVLLTVASLYLVFVYKNAISVGFGAASREDTEKFSELWKGRQ